MSGRIQGGSSTCIANLCSRFWPPLILRLCMSGNSMRSFHSSPCAFSSITTVPTSFFSTIPASQQLYATFSTALLPLFSDISHSIIFLSPFYVPFPFISKMLSSNLNFLAVFHEIFLEVGYTSKPSRAASSMMWGRLASLHWWRRKQSYQHRLLQASSIP